MSHHVYTTRGIVLSSRTRREADRVFAVFTRDLGLVEGLATGVRKEGSKLGGMLSDFSLIEVSLVRGKNSWRITTASLIKSTSLQVSLAKVLSLLEKLVRGEEKNQNLFDEIEAGLNYLSANKLSAENLGAWEIVLVARILFQLGYLAESDIDKEILEASLSEGLFKKVLKEKKKIVEVINEGIHASGLLT